MSNDYPYVKATIIVERADGTTSTFEVPKARNIETNEWSEPVDTEIGKPWRYLTNTINLGLTLKADFDEELGYCYKLQVSDPAVEDQVSPEKRKELADLFLKLSGQSWWEAIREDEFRANLLVDEVIKIGWVPKETNGKE